MPRRVRPATGRQRAAAVLVWTLMIGAVLAVFVLAAPVVGVALTGDYPGRDTARLEEDHPVIVAALWVATLFGN